MRIAIALGICLCSAVAIPAHADEIGAVAEQATPAKNALYAELGGNGAWYSLNYERFLRNDASVRIGAMYMSVTASSGSSTANATWLAVPIMFNYLGLHAGSHALELGGGLDLMYFSAGASSFEATADASGVTPVGTATIGYRYSNPEGGFVFRAGYTPMFFFQSETQKVFHWGGLSFGYRFGS